MFLAVVAAAVAAGLVLISERAAITRTGYRVAELERQRQELLRETRRLEAEVAKRKAPLKIYERAKALEVNAEPPEERLKKLREAEERSDKAKERR
jgi:cell division protein FtsL